MVVGNGQLASSFKNQEWKDTVVFASGVSHSSCKDKNEFKREELLVIKYLNEHQNKKFIYFSSCALSVSEYPKNEYYKHKSNIEDIIRTNHNNYYIIRLPQLFGILKRHNTLINFLYYSIQNNKEFIVYDKAYRYVIEINDVLKFVQSYINNGNRNSIIDVSNTYRYEVIEIVNIFEILLKKKARYKTIEKEDGYILDLSKITNYFKYNNINIIFSKDYLRRHLKSKLLNG